MPPREVNISWVQVHCGFAANIELEGLCFLYSPNTKVLLDEQLEMPAARRRAGHQHAAGQRFNQQRSKEATGDNGATSVFWAQSLLQLLGLADVDTSYSSAST